LNAKRKKKHWGPSQTEQLGSLADAETLSMNRMKNLGIRNKQTGVQLWTL
jgi:hypothetical protein